MLVIACKEGETINIGNNIKLIVSSIEGGQVKLAFEADKCIKILREKLQIEKDLIDAHQRNEADRKRS